MTNLTIGIDPDTKTTGIAIVEKGEVVRVDLIRAKGRKAIDRIQEMSKNLMDWGDLTVDPGDRVAIEWQGIRPSDRRPNDIAALLAVSGAALASCTASREIFLPLPIVWKGSVPKAISQKRILKAAGITIDDPLFNHIPKSMRTHCVDAVGLALWAEKQWVDQPRS